MYCAVQCIPMLESIIRNNKVCEILRCSRVHNWIKNWDELQMKVGTWFWFHFGFEYFIRLRAFRKMWNIVERGDGWTSWLEHGLSLIHFTWIFCRFFPCSCLVWAIKPIFLSVFLFWCIKENLYFAFYSSLVPTLCVLYLRANISWNTAISWIFVVFVKKSKT